MAAEQKLLLELMLPVAAVLVAVNSVLLARAVWRRVQLRRLGRMLDRSRALQQAGRYAEAGRVLDEFAALWAWHGCDKWRPPH